jgi:hypothetical protein
MVLHSGDPNHSNFVVLVFLTLATLHSPPHHKRFLTYSLRVFKIVPYGTCLTTTTSLLVINATNKSANLEQSLLVINTTNKLANVEQFFPYKSPQEK